jgi:release factor glutamine methyltransferase
VRHETIVARLRTAGCVFAEEEADLLLAEAGAAEQLAAMVSQRESGLPLEQVLGWAEFCGLRIAVRPGVFVPRRRTEFLVRQAVSLAPPGAVVVDLCCGSGAVAAAVAAALSDRGPAAGAAGGLAPGLGPVGGGSGAKVYAADVDPVAVECARGNVPGEVFAGDLYEALPRRLIGQVDILVVNAPYVPTDEVGMMPPEARLYEPPVALDGGADGLDILRRVIAGAPQWLTPRGHLLVESSRRQAPQLVEAAARHGLHARTTTAEDLEATAVVAELS